MDKYIYDGDIVCKKCNAEACYITNTDDDEFDCDGTGHYYVGVCCKECGVTHREYYKFTYGLVVEDGEDVFIYNNELKCSGCGEEEGSITNVDELEFNCDGTGHYRVDVYCKNCKETHRVRYNFKYELTDASCY